MEIDTILQPVLLAFFGVSASRFILKNVTFGDLVGFPILVTFLTFILHDYISSLEQEVYWGITGIAGFLLPSLRHFLNGKILARIAKNTYKGMKGATDAFVDALDKELEEIERDTNEDN